MRACFLGQNICALGFGVATLQTPPLLQDEQTGKPLSVDDEHVSPEKDDARQPEPAQIGIGPL